MTPGRQRIAVATCLLGVIAGAIGCRRLRPPEDDAPIAERPRPIRPYPEVRTYRATGRVTGGVLELMVYELKYCEAVIEAASGTRPVPPVPCGEVPAAGAVVTLRTPEGTREATANVRGIARFSGVAAVRAAFVNDIAVSALHVQPEPGASVSR